MGIIFMLLGAGLIYKGVTMPFIKTNKSLRQMQAEMLDSNANKVAVTGFKMAFRMYGKVMLIAGGIGLAFFGLMVFLLF